MEETNTMRKEIKRRIHEVENELRALKELVDSEAFAPKEPELTEFEKAIYNILSFDCDTEDDSFRVEFAKSATKDLLTLAKKEICKGCTVGLDQYWKGREDARKEYEKPITYHFPTYWPPCYHGGVCTNPMKDCINCPRTGGDVGISNTSGTCKKED